MIGKIAAAAVLVASAGAAMADGASGPFGFVQVSTTTATYDYWGSSYNPWREFGGAAALTYSLSGNRSLTIDFNSWSSSDATSGYYATGTSAAAHLDWAMGNGSVGAFGGVLIANDYYSSGNDTNWFAGAEGNTWLNDRTLIDGQFTVIGQLAGYYGMGTVTTGSVGVSYFPMDNLRLEGRAGFMGGQVGDDNGEDAATVTWSFQADYKPQGAPVSLFARLNGYYDNGPTWGNYGYRAITVGARFDFGGKSFRDTTTQSHRAVDLATLSWLRLDGGW